MERSTAFVTHHDCSRHDTGWKHPDHQGRLPAVARAVHRDMLDLHAHLIEVEGVPAAPGDLAGAHSEAYLRRLFACVEEARLGDSVVTLEGDARVSAATGAAVLAMVGCVNTAVRGVQEGLWRNAFCAVRPPGHGADREGPGRFSLVNGVAVAALQVAREGHGPIWIVDLGAAEGRGTRSIVADEQGIEFITVSAEAAEGADTTAAGTAIARTVPDGATGEVFLAALRSALEEAEAGAVPALILLSLGCDALADDPLGSLALEPRYYHPLTRELVGRAERLCGGRLVSVLEEGYAPESMGRAVVQHLRGLAGLEPHDGG